MKCQCCNKDKENLVPHKSVLMGNQVFMCNDCIGGNHEPRFMVLIASHSRIDTRKYIAEDRYCGERIEAKEIILAP